jgi:hypothetical protein
MERRGAKQREIQEQATTKPDAHAVRLALARGLLELGHKASEFPDLALEFFIVAPEVKAKLAEREDD